jgi:hypothetical protein
MIKRGLTLVNAQHITASVFINDDESGLHHDYEWPFNAVWNQPNTWASSALAELPRIDHLEPLSATVGGPAFVLTIDGEHLQDGAVLRWDGVELPTTFVGSTQVTASIGADRLASAGVAEITIRNPGSDPLVSNPLAFTVSNPVPSVTGLSPGSVEAGSGAFALTVNGTGFVSGASVLWNGESLPTTFHNSAHLTAQVNAGLIEVGQAIGVAVRNPDPGGSLSNVVALVVEPKPATFFYLPLVLRGP